MFIFDASLVLVGILAGGIASICGICLKKLSQA